jgi:hypothetical protein
MRWCIGASFEDALDRVKYIEKKLGIESGV